MIIGIIFLCEILFWLAIIIGLSVRYIGKNEKLGFKILTLVPLIDLILLITAGYDMYMGATASIAHALAGVYIGVSLVFGKSMIQWADDRFLYYIVKNGEKPKKLVGSDYAKSQLKGWLKHVLAFIICSMLLMLTVFIVNDVPKTKALTDIITLWLAIIGLDFIFTMSYFIWKKKERL